MPTNKNAQLRYKVLDRCLSNFNVKYDIDDLLREVNLVLDELGINPIQIRQLRIDLKDIRNMGAKIEAIPYVGNRCYYRYADRNFAIYKKELSLEDLEELRSTLNMLGHYRGLPGNSWLEEVISSLECRFGIKPNTEKLIAFDKNEQLKGLEHLSGLIDATVNHHALQIDYRTFSGKEKVLTIHPYYMKQYNGRWFLYGWNEAELRLENLALDRIQRFTLSTIPFIENTFINFNVYFDNVIGATVPNANEAVEIEKVILRFSEKRFPYVVSKPMHRTQKVIGEQTIQITVKPTRELTQQIFSFMPDIEVMAPVWYREEIKQKIEENLKKYISVQDDCTDGK